MSNPTLGHESQFVGPYDILPNIIYTNPTTAYSSQFTTPLNYGSIQTFDSYPDPVWDNPTSGNPSQFETPISYGSEQTYDLYPDSEIINKPNPTLNTSQFTTPLNYGSDQTFDIPGVGNPTKPNPTQINGANNTYKPQFENASGRNTTSQDAVNWKAPTAQASNIRNTTLEDKAFGIGAGVVGGLIGVPQVAQAAQSIIGAMNNIKESNYSTLDLNQLKPLPGVLYADFRARRQLNAFSTAGSPKLINMRLDGTSAATRKSWQATAYAVASANPLGGAYSIFNLDGFGSTGYSWGNHGDPYAIRNDFTIRTHVATKWDDTTKQWTPIKGPERGIPFRGDRVTVIDYNKVKELGDAPRFKNVYKWKPGEDPLGSSIGKDFIKFFFTGPGLTINQTADQLDDVMVFRSIITELSDRFNPGWTETQMIGRADPNYHYTSFTRDLSLTFTVYATSRDELKPIWRKLNALAGYTAPNYSANNMSLTAPWMRITIGDLFHQQPVVLSSLSYTLHDADTTWEINIEEDPYIKQVPHKIEVSCEFNVITDFLPQQGGNFYSLADDYVKGQPARTKNNWLSDFIGSSDDAFKANDFGTRKSKSKETVTLTK